jgi:hypothetical protein
LQASSIQSITFKQVHRKTEEGTRTVFCDFARPKIKIRRGSRIPQGNMKVFRREEKEEGKSTRKISPKSFFSLDNSAKELAHMLRSGALASPDRRLEER